MDFFLTEQWSRSGCHSVRKIHTSLACLGVRALLKCSHDWTSLSCVDLMLTEQWSRSGCHSVKKSPHKSSLFRRESITKLPGGCHYSWVTKKPGHIWAKYPSLLLWSLLHPRLYEEEILGQSSALWVSTDGARLAYAVFNDTLVEQVKQKSV